VQQHLQDGTFAYASDVGAGWGGEAFGKQLGAMTIEGNWITGLLVRAVGGHAPAVRELQRALAGGAGGQLDDLGRDAFGPMPSVQSAADQWKSDNPELVPFLTGADYAQGVPTNKGAADVITDFNAQLESLKTGAASPRRPPRGAPRRSGGAWERTVRTASRPRRRWRTW
jgi:multiple sugar transport system substrate-binding protein